MNSKSDPQGKPNLDVEKAPYGHAEDAPLASAFPQPDASPDVDLLRDGVENAHTALSSFSEDDAPIFPPTNVSLPKEAELPPTPHSDKDGTRDSDVSWSSGFRSFVSAHPLTTVLASAALGALLVRLSR